MKAKISTIALVFLAMLWFSQASVGQVITTAPNISACPGTTVSIPITVSNFTGVASISLTLNINPAVLTYTGYTLSPQLTGGFPVINSPAPFTQVIFAWFALSAGTLGPNAILMTLNFTYLGGNCPLVFDTISNGACLYSDIDSNPLAAIWYSGSVTQAVAPAFVSQPTAATVNEGSGAIFSVTANNAGTYQWQESTNGSTWNNINNGGIYSGATTNSLDISTTTISMNGYQYRCEAKETTCNQISHSDPATLTVNQVTVTIIAQLGSVSSCPANQVTIPVTVTNCNNIGSFSFEVYPPSCLTFIGLTNQNSALSGTVTANQQPNFLGINWIGSASTNVGNGVLFDLQFAYTSGSGAFTFDNGVSRFSDISNNTLPATFVNGTVSPLATTPVIDQQPADQTISANTNTNITVAATGANTYLWEVSTDGGSTWAAIVAGVNYGGITSSDLQIINTPATFDGYKYRCILTETTCNLAVTSNAAMLTVTASSTDITTTIGSVTICPSADSTLMVTIPVNVINFVGVASANFKFNYDTTALVYDTVANLQAELDPYQGGSGLFVANATGGQFGMAWFSVTPSTFGNGKLFDVLFHYISNNSPLVFDPSPGICNYTDLNFNDLITHWVNGNVTLPGPVITSMPTSQVALLGSNATFTVAGNNIDSYQWQKLDAGIWTDLVNGTDYNGVTTGILTVNNTTLAMDGFLFRCKVTGSCGPQYSYVVELMVINSTPVMATLPTLTQCQGPIIIPVTVSNFNDVGSFSVTFNTVGNVLIYNGFQAIDPALTGMSITHTANSVTMSFTTSTPVTIANGTIVELKYVTNAGTTPLDWEPAAGVNFFKSVSGTTLPSTFNSGYVTINSFPGPPAAIQGVNNICQGVLSSTFTTTGAAGSTSYEWVIIPSIAGTIAGAGLTGTVTWNVTFSGLATVTVKGHNDCGVGPIMSKAVMVTVVPIVSFQPIPNACTNDTVVLTSGMPTGGTYTGPGIVNNYFYPGVTGVGTFTITYEFSNAGCSASATQTVTVHQSPVVTFTLPFNLTVVLPTYPAFLLTGGLPIGGTYSGTGVNSATGIFSPMGAGNGIKLITYTYTTMDGCTESATQTINVDPVWGIVSNGNTLSINIQPNPTKGMVQIKIQNITESVDLGIFNDLGQKVYEEKVVPQNGMFFKELNLTDQPR
ncbi:MAG: hypothetical protein NTU44_18870, partial [Bacteroidetes bacterium]|nr:hypothetical protein [Bacteroidota bacterium]